MIVKEPEVGEIYTGIVKTITDFGAFVEILPGKDGLCHISELDYKRVEKAEDYVEVGQELKVKVIKIDDKTGKISLSHKDTMEKPEGYEEHKERPRREGGRGGNYRDNNNRGNGQRRPSNGGRPHQNNDYKRHEEHHSAPAEEKTETPEIKPEPPKHDEKGGFFSKLLGK